MRGSAKRFVSVSASRFPGRSGIEEPAVVEDPDEAGRIAARGDVEAAVGPAGGGADEAASAPRTGGSRPFRRSATFATMRSLGEPRISRQVRLGRDRRHRHESQIPRPRAAATRGPWLSWWPSDGGDDHGGVASKRGVGGQPGRGAAAGERGERPLHRRAGDLGGADVRPDPKTSPEELIAAAHAACYAMAFSHTLAEAGKPGRAGGGGRRLPLHAARGRRVRREPHGSGRARVGARARPGRVRAARSTRASRDALSRTHCAATSRSWSPRRSTRSSPPAETGRLTAACRGEIVALRTSCPLGRVHVAPAAPPGQGRRGPCRITSDTGADVSTSWARASSPRTHEAADRGRRADATAGSPPEATFRFSRIAPAAATTSSTRPRGRRSPRLMTGAGGAESTIPSGFTYLGQFIDHDLTFDRTT